MSIDPGVPHRDSFAKYAAAFFTISRSSLVLASSRRKRLFSASNSAGEPFMGVAADTAANLPLRLRRIQFPRLDAGIPSRCAAWLMPTVSANRNASCLYSSVYLRFATVSLAIAFSVHQNIIKILMYVETGQGHEAELTIVRLEARIDLMTFRLEARLDAMTYHLDAMLNRLDAKLSLVGADLGAKLDRLYDSVQCVNRFMWLMVIANMVSLILVYSK